MSRCPTLAVALLFALAAADAAGAFGVRRCGSNDRCRVVDVLSRSTFGQTLVNTGSVGTAWRALVDNGPCADVADVVVGGTFGEDGAPGKSTPAGFASHLGRRCSIVVNYQLDAFGVIDAQAYDDSTEHGRKALALVLNSLDLIRRQRRRNEPIRVWGHSKGAAIAASTWRMEARNGRTKFIGGTASHQQYVDACPRNNCFYFGFGYPRTMERNNRFSISRAAASLLSTTDDGFIKKPGRSHNDWHRLTTFTNLSDPIYECNLSCALSLAFNRRCHEYQDFLSDEGYAFFDEWNRFGESSSAPAPDFIGNHCGDVGDPGTFSLAPDDVRVAPRERLRLGLEWTVPEGGWRVLDEMQVRLRDGDDVALWVRFDEAANQLGVYDGRRERFTGAAAPGDRTVLKGRGARLHLGGSRVVADGALDPSVLLELEVSLGHRYRGRELVVEVLATDDLGGAQDFRPAGTVKVRGRDRSRR